jgi:hypothetical protein
LASLLASPSAGAEPGLAVGAVENQLMWNTADTLNVAGYLGLKTMAVSLTWEPTQNDLDATQILGLNRAVTTAGSLRIVLGVHNNWTRTPVDAASRQRYCDFAANALRRYPQINDIIVWNEPNVAFFWRPQFDANGASEAPRGYFELAAHCYDVLHGVRPGLNVVGPVNSHWGNDNPNANSNVTHSPSRFIRELGAVYRASGRTRPIFDTLGHHPYPRRSDEHPSVQHTDPAVISIGDTARLLEVMAEAFGGTAQPIPQDGMPIWYLETGYQTTIPQSKFSAYDGDLENWPGPVPDVAPGTAVDQAKQLADSLRLMYCQPYVEAIFNFLLKDEPQMAGWQSGVFWADGTPKGSLDTYRAVIQEINGDRVNCSTVPGAAEAAAATAAVVNRGGQAGGPAAAAGSPGAQRSVTKLTYRGVAKAEFGQLRLRARLTRGATASDAGLGARQVTFVVDSEAYLTTTDARGFASLVPSPPIRPGNHRVEMRFRGDAVSLGTGARIDVQIVNARGSAASRGRLKLSPKLSATLVARSDGTTVSGGLTLRRPNAKATTVRLTALGIAGKGRAAWLSGTLGGARYDVHVKRLPKGKVRVQVARNGVDLHRAATLPARLLRVR